MSKSKFLFSILSLPMLFGLCLASVAARADEQTLRIYTQNMAFLAPPGTYFGATSREQARARLIQYLRAEQPDIVGLQEMQAQSARNDVIKSLKDIYPWVVDGPRPALLGMGLGASGGLLLLSKYPIVTSEMKRFEKCAGEDCFESKGAIFSEIMIDNRFSIDVFVAHIQNDSPIFASDAKGMAAVLEQFGELGQFIAKMHNPAFPALLMGDHNVDGNTPALHAKLVGSLTNAKSGAPVDIWQSIGSGPGFTEDAVSSFKPDKAPLPLSSPLRGLNGRRTDYFFSWNGQKFIPHYTDIQVKRIEILPGRELSDHYGVMTTLGGYSSTSEDKSGGEGYFQ